MVWVQRGFSIRILHRQRDYSWNILCRYPSAEWSSEEKTLTNVAGHKSIDVSI